MPPAKRRSPKAIIEYLVFGSLTGLGVLFFCTTIVPAVYGHWRTREKTTVPATLISVEAVDLGRVGRPREGTAAKYEYEFGGGKYQGEKVTLWARTGRFYRELDAALRHRATIRVYVDPKDPRYSVYHREFTPWPFAGAVALAFGAAGFGVYGLRWCWKQRRRGVTGRAARG